MMEDLGLVGLRDLNGMSIDADWLLLLINDDDDYGVDHDSYYRFHFSLQQGNHYIYLLRYLPTWYQLMVQVDWCNYFRLQGMRLDLKMRPWRKGMKMMRLDYGGMMNDEDESENEAD